MTRPRILPSLLLLALVWPCSHCGLIPTSQVRSGPTPHDVGPPADLGFVAGASLGLGGASSLDSREGVQADLGPGGMGSLLAGARWKWLRADAELLCASLLVDDIQTPTGDRPVTGPGGWYGLSEGAGTQSLLGGMFNGSVEVPFGESTRLLVGGGVGRARVELAYDFNVTLLGLPTDRNVEYLDDSDMVDAWQVKVGILRSRGKDTPLWCWLGYRYVVLGDMGFRSKAGDPLHVDGVGSHFVEFGIQVRF